MTSEIPMISVVVPTFNVEKYITPFINCIVKQTYDNWELIIVDDGSTDNTYEIVERFAVRDQRIHLLKRNRQPKGSVTCRNIGQENAKGVYLIHFDADDLVEPFCFEQRVNFMEKNKDVDYATFKGVSIFQQVDGEFRKAGRTWGNKPAKDILSCFLEADYPFSVWNNIYRISAFKNYFWDEKVRIYTDFSYIIPAIISEKKHAFDENSKPDYLYRMGQTGAMTASFITSEKYESTKYLFSKTLLQISSLSNKNRYKKSFSKFFALQFERVLVNGSTEQIIDFYNFFQECYGSRIPFRIKVICLILKKDFNNNKTNLFRKKTKLLFYLLYSPKTIVTWIFGRINRKAGAE